MSPKSGKLKDLLEEDLTPRGEEQNFLDIDKEPLRTEPDFTYLDESGILKSTAKIHR